MNDHTYLSLDDLIFLHTQLVEKFGGSFGIFDINVLISALERPRSGYYSSLDEEGAALFQSLWLNHGFLDGNKRIAFAALDVFLRLNGIPISNLNGELKRRFLELNARQVKNLTLLASMIRDMYS